MTAAVDAAGRYWLTLFTHSTWRTFLDHDANLVGFREPRWLTVREINPGDYLLCYLTGVSRFIGALTVTSKAFFDPTPIWREDPLPARLQVKPVVLLSPETALPITELNLSIFDHLSRPNAWTARLRQTPSRWRTDDGEIILEALLDAKLNPVVRELDYRKLGRQPAPFRQSSTPNPTLRSAEPTPPDYPVNVSGFRAPRPQVHTEIQWLLLKLGNDLGLDVWVARNDRGRDDRGQKFTDLPRLLKQLPRQFDRATMGIVELIDVLWLRGSALLAAFEIESTSSVYSGLLRMADLATMQPNIQLPLYIVAPDERRAKVCHEINRPTFANLSPPLSERCRYIAFSALQLKAREAETMLEYLRPEFIDAIAEHCPPPA